MAPLKVVESKATLGLPSAVASPGLRREGAYGTTGVGVRCLSDAGDVKEKTGPCAGIGVASVQGRQEEGQGKKRQ